MYLEVRAHTKTDLEVCAHTMICSDHRDIYAIAIAIAHTNIPLSSVRTWTQFHHPRENMF